MARITWIGEEGESSPTTVWYGRELRVGEAIEIEDERLIAKAKGNKFFKVEDDPSFNPSQWREPDTEADPADTDPTPSRHRPAKRR